MVWSATNSGFTAASHAHKADFFPKPPEPFLLKKGLALQGRAKERESHYMLTYLCQHFPESQTCSSSQQLTASGMLPIPCLLPHPKAFMPPTGKPSRQILDKKNPLPSTPTGSGNDFNDDCPPLHMGQEAQPSHGPDNLTGLKNVQEARSRKLAQA